MSHTWQHVGGESVEALELSEDVVDAVELVNSSIELLEVLRVGTVVEVLAILWTSCKRKLDKSSSKSNSQGWS